MADVFTCLDKIVIRLSTFRTDKSMVYGQCAEYLRLSIINSSSLLNLEPTMFVTLHRYCPVSDSITPSICKTPEESTVYLKM